MLECAPGGRDAFAPGASGWRLQSVTNYGGSVVPLFSSSLALTSPNNTVYRINVSNAGVLSTTAI